MFVPVLTRDGNEAVDINPPNAQEHIVTHTSDWLWAAFSLITLALVVMTCLTFMRPRGKRLFHQLALIVLLTTSLSYFSMASDLGSTPVVTEFRGHGQTRQVWYVRYIQWFITFPILLLELLLATGLSLSDIITTAFVGAFLVIMGLVGALVPSTYKWGYYVFGAAALIYIWFVLLWQAPRGTFAQSGTLKKGYVMSSAYMAFMLITYPICWALSEGANVISPTGEMIWYGILDIIAGPVFLFFFLWEIRGVDYHTFGLHSGKYTDLHSNRNSTEKPPVSA
ncbi:heat shock protein 30 [Irpex lacteus]|nr:heat shock protein 30 [Irpex lacteus]